MGCITSKHDHFSASPEYYAHRASPSEQNDFPSYLPPQQPAYYGGQNSDSDSPRIAESYDLYDSQLSRTRPAWLRQTDSEARIPVSGMQFQASASQGLDYEVTARGLNKLKDVIYPSHVFDSLATDMHILDVGAGKGTFVRDLRNLGFKHARGIDKEEASSGILRVDIAELDSSHYHKKLDRIFSSWSLFTYKETTDLQRQSLMKMANWLKPGGKIYLGPVDGDRIARLIEDIPSLSKTNAGLLFGGDEQQWVELSLSNSK